MTTESTIIAKHGGLSWEAGTCDAGPYYLNNRWMIFASFGTRSLAISRPGSVWQREAFETSRAAFEACKLVLDPECYNAEEIRRVVRVATVAARAEWKRFGETIGRIGGSSAVAAYHAATLDRVCKKLEGGSR